MNSNHIPIDQYFICKTKEEVDIAIHEFINIDVQDNDFIKSKFFELFGVFPFNIFYLKKEGLKDFGIFRARRCNQVVDNKNIEQFSYPPLNPESPLGRANLVGKSVFYGSDSPNTCIRESKDIKVGDEFYVSQWYFKEEKFSHDEIPFFSMAINNLSNRNPWRTVVKSTEDIIEYFKKKYLVNDELANVMGYWVQRLSSVFTEMTDSKYHISAFLADQAIFSNPFGADLTLPLVFPSVKQELNMCNFAIHPAMVTEYMYVSKVIKVSILDIHGDKIRYSYSDIGVPDSENKVQWYNFGFENNKLACQIKSVRCNCGKELEIIDSNKLELYQGEVVLNIEAIIKFLMVELDINSLRNIGNPFEWNGLLECNELTRKISNTGLSAIIDQKIHHDLIIELRLRQYITYTPILEEN